MLDFIQGRLQPIPAPSVSDPRMTLADVVGTDAATAIEHAGQIRFQAVGDTGRGSHSPQQYVADVMNEDYDLANPATSPAFFLHLGDVIYGHSKDQEYRPQFYEPYLNYRGKIIAIPGNHDGEVFAGTDPVTLGAFLANFCPNPASGSPPPITGTIFRELVPQPGVYWRLDAPFVDIIGLYSNAAENPGFISGTIPGNAQKFWLAETLKQIAEQRKQGPRKALIIATHHPPYSYSGSGGHPGSPDMRQDIDDACKDSVTPDVFLSGHSHTYQRWTREIPWNGGTTQIPYIVAGIGGHADQAIVPADGSTIDGAKFEYSRQGYGYLLVETDGATITVRAYGVDGQSGTRTDGTPTSTDDFDHVTVDLKTRRMV
jgi:predicted phosphodiesterase